MLITFMSIIIFDMKPYWFIRVLNRKVNMKTNFNKQIRKLLKRYHRMFDCFGNKIKRKGK